MSANTEIPKKRKPRKPPPTAEDHAALAEAIARFLDAREAYRIAKVNAREARKALRRAKRQPMSGLNAAYKVLQGYCAPIDAHRIVKEMAAQGLWKSPKGLTPAGTISVSIKRDIKAKGAASRFARGKEPGTFMANPLLPENIW